MLVTANVDDVHQSACPYEINAGHVGRNNQSCSEEGCLWRISTVYRRRVGVVPLRRRHVLRPAPEGSGMFLVFFCHSVLRSSPLLVCLPVRATSLLVLQLAGVLPGTTLGGSRDPSSRRVVMLEEHHQRGSSTVLSLLALTAG